MTILVREAPVAVTTKHAIPFRLFIPRELEEAQARGVWNALRHLESAVLADPFAAPGVSTVFPGVLYSDDHDHGKGLAVVAAALAPAEKHYPEDLEDAWLEVWVPDAYEGEAEAHDITDLTQG